MLVLSLAANATQPASVLEFNGLMHNAIGGAVLEIIDERLVVSNIGEGGFDGVAVELEGLSEFSAEWGNVGYTGIPNDAAMQFGARGILADENGSTLFIFMLAQGLFLEQGPLYLLEITPDYAQSGATRYRYEIYDRGEHVITETSETALVYTRMLSNIGVPYPTGVRLVRDDDGRLGIALTWFKVNDNVQAIFPFRDNAFYFTDELRIFPDDNVAPLDSLAELNIWLSQIDPLTILSEEGVE